MRSTDADEDARPTGATMRRSRWWAGGAVAAMVAFAASVVLSTGSSSVPVGATGAMPGMSMSADGGRMAITMRDLDDREVRLPGGRPGVVVFAGARGCASCVAAVRTAGDAVRQAGVSAQVIVVMADSGTARKDVGAFARAVGRSRARYVVDDRNSGLTSMLDAPGLGRAVVYDARGRIVARPDPGVRRLASALRSARR